MYQDGDIFIRSGGRGLLNLIVAAVTRIPELAYQTIARVHGGIVLATFAMFALAVKTSNANVAVVVGAVMLCFVIMAGRAEYYRGHRYVLRFIAVALLLAAIHQATWAPLTNLAAK